MKDDEWRPRARCASSPDPDLWVPNGYLRSADLVDVMAAKRECTLCPVRLQCLESAMRREWGVVADARDGIYGALTPGERFRLEAVLRGKGIDLS